jgi:hypothetical protein
MLMDKTHKPFGEVLKEVAKTSVESVPMINVETAVSSESKTYVLWTTLAVRENRYVEKTLLPPFVAAVYDTLDGATKGVESLQATLSKYCQSISTSQIYTIAGVDILTFSVNKDFPQQDWVNFVV